MSVKIVNVTYNGEGVPLTVHPLDVELANGDHVRWDFHNVPQHCIAYIFFPEDQPGLPAQPFGPFQYLEPFVRTVHGIGNTGIHGNYPYTAMVLDSTGARATSLHTSQVPLIRNPTAHENTSPDALVRYRPEAEPEHRFLVRPTSLRLERERTAIWYIEGIPRDHFVTFHFDGFPADPLKGPFLSFSLSRGFGSSWLANGAGFLSALLNLDPSQIPNPIQYFVRLRNSQGIVIEQDDPVIEPLESPPGT